MFGRKEGTLSPAWSAPKSTIARPKGKEHPLPPTPASLLNGLNCWPGLINKRSRISIFPFWSMPGYFFFTIAETFFSSSFNSSADASTLRKAQSCKTSKPNLRTSSLVYSEASSAFITSLTVFSARSKIDRPRDFKVG